MSVKIAITGDKVLDRRFQRLKVKTQTKLVRSGITAGGRVVVKAIKKAIPSTWKDGRKAIGFRLLKGKGSYQGQTFAKAGVGVGLKKSKGKARNRSGRPGVGIGAANLHWFILGTAERFTGSKRVGARRRGVTNRRVATGGRVRRTGRMKPYAIVKMAAAQAETTAQAAIRKNIMAGIEREWAKR